MTYIEFFNNVAIENVCACLTDVPKRVVYIGRDVEIIESKIKKYKRVFGDRNHNIEFIAKKIEKESLVSAVSVLQEIVDTYSDCAFGITGGDEMALIAFGIVYERNRKNKNIQIHKFDIKNNKICDCDNDGRTVFKDLPTLTVKENIRIYGGDILYGDVWSDNTYEWDLRTDFIDDIEKIWSICKEDTKRWNAQIGVFGVADTVGVPSEDKLTVTAEKTKIKNELANNRTTYKITRRIVNSLKANGLLTCFEETEDTLKLTFKNAQVKRCLVKAGQALEMKTYLAVLNAKDENGEKIYNDVVNGTLIDWDGKFHNEKVEDIYDTENEIDVIAMHGMVPVFISCKNGLVEVEELYKLNTVALRFGGRYAKKVLVASYIPKDTESGKYLIQRANNMNIKIVNLGIKDGVRPLSETAFERKISDLWR